MLGKFWKIQVVAVFQDFFTLGESRFTSRGTQRTERWLCVCMCVLKRNVTLMRHLRAAVSKRRSLSRVVAF